jgi:hypothetical protein
MLGVIYGLQGFREPQMRSTAGDVAFGNTPHGETRRSRGGWDQPLTAMNAGEMAPPDPSRRRAGPRRSLLSRPRILLYACDRTDLAERDLGLAEALIQEFPSGNVLLTTGSAALTRSVPPERVEVIKVPSLPPADSPRPLLRARIERLRQRLLCTVFDGVLPDLLILDLCGEAAEREARMLLARAKALSIPALLGVDHGRSGESCFREASVLTVCEACRARTRASAREALRARLT